MERHPSRMLDVLRLCGALARILPELRASDPTGSAPNSPDTAAAWEHLKRVVDTAALWNLPLAVRFACLTHTLVQRPEPDAKGEPTAITHPRLLKALFERIRVPVECRELADVVAREHLNLQASGALDAAEVVRLLERCDALRKPERFAWVLQACACVQHTPLPVALYPQAQRLIHALNVVLDLPTQAVAEAAMAQGLSGKEVGELIHMARVKALQQAL
jgi:tRNA nucleotidyltransferase (CCA-adding enzyme)